jgi:hypothetical protein
LNFTEKRIGLMNIIYADYNIYHNSIDICTYAGYILRIDCAKAEEGLKTTPNSECALNALAIDNPVKYARLYLDGTMQMWIDAEDSLVSLRGIFLPIVFFHLATFNCHMNITAISAYSHCGSLY